MKCLVAAVALLAASLAPPAYAGEVKLQLANGRVTLQARNATVREILAEWSRVGQVKIVNGERVIGPPVTLDFQALPEAQALSTLLRSVSGYMAAPKARFDATSSIYDRIVILATPRTLNASSAFTTTPPAQQQLYRTGMPPGMPNPAMLDEQDEPTGAPPTYPGGPPGYVPPGRGMLTTQPQMQTNPPTTPTVPQGAPGTVSPVQQVPGAQPQPGLVVQPTGAPGTVTPPVVKKPGGPGDAGGGGDSQVDR